jgi:hypothetical protein
MYVIAAATPTSFGDPSLVDETLHPLDPDRIRPGDVVAYDKRLQLFKLVECKLGSQSTAIGKTFGQIAAYCAVLSTRGRDFVEAFNEKVHLPFSQLLEATHNAKRIQVAFYVALTHDVCKQQIELIRAVKGLLPLVGIIRVKPDGKCRESLWHKGKRDSRLAKATPTVIKISQNGN